MGTDIHPYVEAQDDGGVWRYVPFIKLEINRNYDLFGILADVRNGAGLEPISEPRGLPKDVAPETKALYRDECDYAESWVTLQELYDYDWSQPCAWDSELSLRQSIGITRIFNQLEPLAALVGPQRVRIVFWFDS